jgi:hypothetical protein
MKDRSYYIIDIRDATAMPVDVMKAVHIIETAKMADSRG